MNLFSSYMYRCTGVLSNLAHITSLSQTDCRLLLILVAYIPTARDSKNLSQSLDSPLIEELYISLKRTVVSRMMCALRILYAGTERKARSGSPRRRDEMMQFVVISKSAPELTIGWLGRISCGRVRIL